MSRPSKGWSWFERDSAADPTVVEGRETTPDLPDPGHELRQMYARCFSTNEGEKVLAHLRAVTLERAFGPGVSTETLRHIEGQRQLVSYIAALCEHGRNGR